VGTNEDCQCLSDIVFFRGKLYAIGVYNGQQYLLAIEIADENGNSEPRASRIECIFVGAPITSITSHCSYLVELHGRLLMIRRQIINCREEYCWAGNRIVLVAGVKTLGPNSSKSVG
jgi:hypothetical protein